MGGPSGVGARVVAAPARNALGNHDTGFVAARGRWRLFGEAVTGTMLIAALYASTDREPRLFCHSTDSHVFNMNAGRHASFVLVTMNWETMRANKEERMPVLLPL